MSIEKNMNTRIQHKHDIEANWNKAINFIPKKGELIVYDPDENYNYSRVKIGDGISTANELPFIIAVDTSLTQSGKAADAKAVGDAINAIPVSTTDDGYTEITGLRQAISTNIVKSGNAITVTTALEGDETTTSEITLNSEGYPTTIVTDGVECAISWEGFDASTATIDTTLDEINGE